jgi:hypothetical protein
MSQVTPKYHWQVHDEDGRIVGDFLPHAAAMGLVESLQHHRWIVRLHRIENNVQEVKQ